MSYSKMIVIPQEEYIQLTSIQNDQQPISSQLVNLTKKDNEIENINDPYRRMELHADNIEQRRQLRNKLRSFISLSTPRQSRARAEKLFDFIDPHLKFNERGEVIDQKSGNVIRNSHIDDLLQHAVRDMRRKVGEPTGWEYFRNVLIDNNVPHNIIGKPTISEMTVTNTTVDSRKRMRPQFEVKKEITDPELQDVKPKLRRTRQQTKIYSKY